MHFMRLLKPFRYALAALVLAWVQASAETSYLVVTTSSGAPAGTAQSFISSAQAQFESTLFTNPYVPNTWKLTLYGANPTYTPPPIIFPSTGTYIVQIGTETRTVYQSTEPLNYIYASAWRDGQAYERHDNISTIGWFTINCSSSTFWTVPVDSMTCISVLGAVAGAIVQKDYTEPTAVPLKNQY